VTSPPESPTAALQALSEGRASEAELRLLDRLAATSPEWAAAVAAHRPISAEAGAAVVERIGAEFKTIPLRRRLLPAGIGALAAAAAAAVVFLALSEEVLPPLSLDHVELNNPALCIRETDRGACDPWVVKADLPLAVKLEVRVFGGADGETLLPAKSKQDEQTGNNLQVEPDDPAAVPRWFLVGRPGRLPATLAAARAAGGRADDWQLLDAAPRP
jgi:hypothetical protein